MTGARGADRVLVELRPCFQGHAGIPQETRLVYAMLARQPGIEPFGLISTGAGFPTPGTGRDLSVAEKSKLLIAIDRASQGMRSRTFWAKLRRRLIKGNSPLLRRLAAGREEAAPLVPLDPAFFGDFIWTRLLAATLAPEHRQRVLGTGFVGLGASWNEANMFCSRATDARRVETTGFDFYLSQTPSPFRLSKGTRTIVRYHDAIPLFWPHTISDTTAHNKVHLTALRTSLREQAVFACTSEPVLNDLLQVAPEAEGRAEVIPDLVSPAFRPEPRPARLVAEIMASRRFAGPEGAGDGGSLKDEVQRLLATKAPERFVMAVSTIEPRKNFDLLLRAWQLTQRDDASPGTLVIVGRPGWRYEEDLKQIRTLARLGRVVHLAGVPLEELRILYSAAAAVVCPSRAEGFDLSGVEAMACASPVLASDIPVHRWVYGDAALYFDPYDPAALGQLIAQSLAADAEGPLLDLRVRGPARARLYGEEALAPRWMRFFDRFRLR